MSKRALSRPFLRPFLRPSLRLAVSLAATAALGGCATLGRWFGPKREVRPDVIGVVLPLSEKYEPIGRALLDGIELATKEGAPTDSGRFKDLLADLPEHDGATGPTVFDSDRETRTPLFFLQITPEGIREVPMRADCARPAVSAAFEPTVP